MNYISTKKMSYSVWFMEHEQCLSKLYTEAHIRAKSIESRLLNKCTFQMFCKYLYNTSSQKTMIKSFYPSA